MTLPMHFEPNRGQANDESLYIGRSGGYEIHFTPDGAALQMPSAADVPRSLPISLAGANKDARIVPAAALAGKSNYLLGSDASTWITNLPNYGQLQYQQVYPGIDLVFYGNRGRLEYDFLVSPTGNADAIALRVPQTAQASVDANGDLTLKNAGASIQFLKPVIYQFAGDGSGRKEAVAGAYDVFADVGGTLVKFSLGEYDHSRPLIIDPVLSYSTNANITGNLESIAVDGTGNAYILSQYYQPTVTKLSSDGSTVVYTTTVGSNYSATGTSIAVDSTGKAHFVSYANTGYPTTNNSYRPVSGGDTHVAYTVLTAAGDGLAYSTYLLGSSTDYPLHVAVDSGGKAYISGFTYSSDFPNTGSGTFGGSYSAFVTKMDSTKSGDAGLLYSNLIPSGASYASSPSVAIDSSFNAYVAINADRLAVTPGAYNFFGINYYNGGSYVSKYDASGALVYTAYLGYGEIRDIAVDGGGSVYATGRSDYGDFPATAGAYQTQYPYGYVAKLDPTGSTLVYSTFLSGPSGQVQPQSISLLPGCATNCVAYIGGSTAASDFPAINAIQNLAGGGSDAFIVTLSGDGSAATFSSYVGGSTTDDYGQSFYQHIPAVRLDNAGNMYLGGNTSSADFPFSSQIGTGAYLVKVSPSSAASLIPNTYSINFNSGTVGVPVQQNLVLRNYGTATLTLNNPTITGDFSQSNSCGGSIAPGSSCTFQLSFTPTNAGQRYGAITFTHNGVNSPTQVQLTGYGYDQAYITLSPQQIQFSPQTVGTTSAVQPITVTNTGSQPASFSSISINDAINFAQTNNCPSVLAKGATCTVNVTFNPTNVGNFSTPLYVSYSSGYNGNSYVMLYGTGTQGSASAVVSPGSLQFADDLVGDTNNYQIVYVTNTGTVPITMGGATVSGDFTINYNSCGVNAVVGPNSSCSLYVYFAPTAVGTRSGTLSISSTAAGFPQSVNLSGNGIAPVSGISLSPVTMTFADQVLNTASSVQSVVVSNTGTNQLVIERVYSTSPDFLISYSSCSTVSLSPLQTCGINIQFQPTGSGQRTGSVVLVDSDSSSPQTITLSGNGLAPTTPLYVSPQLLSFDDTVVNTTSQLTFYMTNPGNTAITVSSITSDSPDFAVTYNGCSSVSPSVYNYSCSVNVGFQPTSLGLKTGTLTINDSGTGSPHTVSLQGNSIASTQSVIITPQAYTFGDQVIGTTSSYGGFTFYNPGTSPVDVSSVSASGDYSVTNSCSTISAGSYCYVYVQFTPTAAGLRSGTLTMFDDAPGNPHTVALTGNGLTASSTVEVSPSSTNFLDQPVGTASSAQVIYFYNTGNSKVTIASLVASGDFAISSNGCGTTISPGSYCYAYVTFTPSAPGARTGALTMADDAPGSPHGANLSGNGLTATKTLVLSPASLDFGNLVVNGTAASQYMYLVNNGSQPVKITAITPSANVTSSGCVTTLSDGSSCQLTVTFQATAAGTQTGTVTVTSDATGSPQVINISGNGVASTPAVSVIPNGVAFNQQVTATTSGNIGVSFKNSSGASLTVSGVAATGDFSVVSNGCTTVTDGSSCSVVVNFTPTAAGVRTGTLTFTHNGTGGSIAANLTGFGLTSTKSAELTPTGITFTDQVVGTSSTVQTVYLYNQGTVPFNVSGTPTISGDFSFTSNTCSGAVSNYCYVQVKFQPATTGARSGVVTISDDSPTSPHTISLVGTGIASTNTVYVTATSLGYPDQPLNTDSTVQTIYLYDTGNTNVNLGAPVITGDFSITYKSCSTTVSAGSYCYYQVKFTPTATGTRTGSLSLPSDSSSGTQTIALSGNGIAATKTIVLSTNTLSFGDTPIGVTNSNNQSFYLYNTGSLPVTVSSATVTGDFTINYNSCNTISAGSYCYIYVQFTPTQSGTRTGTVQVSDDATGNPHQVTLSGQGVAVVKTARLSVNSMVFPDQAVGTTSSSQYAYLYNQSNVPLNISSIVVTGDFIVSYQSCGTPPTSVSVNSYCYVYLTFTPTTTGTRSGTLTFTDDATNSPHVMTLSGKGTSPNPSITVSTTSLVFGSQEVSSTSSVQYVYLYSNSNVPITIGTATVDNAEFAIYYTYCSSFNAPGQSCYYEINFTPSTTGTRAGSLTIPSNATGSPIKVSLTGTGIAAGSGPQFSQTSVEFGNGVVGVQSPGVTVYYSNAGSTSIAVSSTTISGDFIKDNGCNGPTTVGAKSYCAVTLYFKPSTTGSISGTLTITDNAAGSPHNIALHGTGVPAAPNSAVNPNNLQFSNQLVGVTSSGQTVSLTNTGTATLTVSGVNITPSTDFAVYSNGCTSVAPNNYCYITLTFNPTAGGLRSATLQIADNTTTSPHSVALSGTGIAASPVYAISTNNIVFGSFGVGTPSNPAGVTLYNTGNSAMTISSISASSEFSVSSNNCGTSLAANSNCSFNVTFTPAATGVRTGIVTISDNAAGNPHQIALTGTGIAPIGAQVSPGTLIFQNQAVSTSSSAQTVTLSVTGAGVTVSSVSLAGGDFSQTNNCSGAYTYNSACYVNVTFAPTAVGTRTGTLTITDNSPASPHVVALSGNGTGSPAVTLSSTTLNFNSVNKGTPSAVQTVTVTNTGNGPLGLGTITASGDYAQTNNCSPNLNANVSCTISVTFTPTTYGTRTGTVTINDNATGNPHTVNLTGIGLASGASVGPTALTFTTQSVGTTSAAQGVTLTNLGTLPLNISSIASNSTEFPQSNTCSATLAVNGNCVISVKFAPSGAGARSGSLSITSDGGNITVPLSGTGTGPVASFDKTNLTFGSVTVGTPSATQTITLASAGDTALTIASITASGDFSETNNCPASLAATSTCTIQVTFTPTAPGSRTGFVSVVDNAANSPQQITLGGSGFGASISFNPPSLNFSTVQVGSTSTAQAITLSNAGTQTLSITSIAATGDFAQTNNCASSLAASASCTVNVTFTPTAAGSRSGSLNVVNSTGTQSAPLSGFGVTQGLTFNPGSLPFGSLPVGLTSAAQTVTVTANGALPVTITNIAASGDFALATNSCPSVLQATSTCTISVTFTPTAPGARSGAVTFTDDAPGSPQAVALTGTGTQPTADLVVTGTANPKSAPPGGSATFNVAISNSGPSAATGVTVTLTSPSNASLQSVTPSAGTCTGTSPITCTLPTMAANSTVSIVMAVNNTAQGPMTTTISASANESDPNTTNNSLPLTSDTSVADIQVVAASTTTTLSGQPAFTMAVTNNGPSNASGVVATYDLDRFGYVNSVASQGSCSFAAQLVCNFGSIATGASASVTIAVQPPDSGWTSIEARATANQYDPVPNNNVAQISPSLDGSNTRSGTNVTVNTADPATGATANLVFATVTRPGSTTMAAVAASAPPHGYRSPRANLTYDFSTSAQFSGAVALTLHFAANLLYHPAEARLFHNEGGVWVDRTASLNPAGSIAGVTGSLSQFAIFEPPDQPPVANPGTAVVVAATNNAGNQVQLNGSLSTDPESDALTYKWTGPFPEGNGTVTGAHPLVTMPVGASQVTLVVNDGEVDSAPIAQAVTVSDFAVSANVSALSVVRGQTANLTIALSPKFGAYDRAVTLDCANLPADLTCQFAQPSATPGSNGSTVMLTISAAKTTSAAATHGGAPKTFALWLLGLGLPFGFVSIAGNRKRRLGWLLLIVVLAATFSMVGCGGGAGGSSFQPTPTPTPAGSTSTINVTATSSGIQHSVALTVTRN